MFSYVWKNGTPKNVPEYESKYEVCGLLPFLWIEHCVECAAPYCYTTCNMFKPRADGRCLRFETGVHPIKFHDNVVGGQLTFRQWAKLEGSIGKFFEATSVDKLFRVSNVFNKTGVFVNKLLDIGHISWYRHRPNKSIESALAIYFGRTRFANTKSIDGFLISVYNHESDKRKLFMEITEGTKTVYKHSFLLNPGWQEELIPIEKMPVDPNLHQLVRIYLEGVSTGTFTFRFLDFVTFKKISKLNNHFAKKVKCVVWDLDNTLWNGVIGDTVNRDIVIKEESVRLIKELDNRGILQSIVSKNTFDVAWTKIKELKLDEYFLYPAINWGRKSQNLLSIANELNINIDTFALIDDSAFERNEVSEALPQVRVYDVTDIENLLDKDEFDIPITEESPKRRLSYIVDGQRKMISASYGDDYDSFLRDCQIHFSMFFPDTEDDKLRCVELLQRSNQYNIANVKRDTEGFNVIYTDNNYSLYAIRIYDKFGDYGIVGFASIEKVSEKEYQLRDFVMSCRVAQKKVERTFFKELVSTLRIGDKLKINLHKTDRNKPLQEELKNMPFDVVEKEDLLTLQYSVKNEEFVKDNILIVQRVSRL